MSDVFKLSVEQLVLIHQLGRRRRAQDLPQPLLPFLDVEVVLVEQRAPQDGRELVERGEQLGDRLTEGLDLEGLVRRPHVLEDALLGARGDDRLRVPVDENVGPPSRAPVLLDGHQADDGVGAPVLAVPQEHHPVPPDIHRGLRCAGHSFFIFFFSSRSCCSAAASRAARSISPLSSSSLRSMPDRAPPACCRSRHARSADRSASVDGRSRSARASCACISASSRSSSACSSRSAASFRSSTPARSRCFAANRAATATVSWSWISAARRPRRSASASRWRSSASSPSVWVTASRVACTDSFASTTASRI